jgi:hypothetical protein
MVVIAILSVPAAIGAEWWRHHQEREAALARMRSKQKLIQAIGFGNDASGRSLRRAGSPR